MSTFLIVLKVWAVQVAISVAGTLAAAWRFLTIHHPTTPDLAPAPWAHIDTRPLDERDVDLWAAQFRGPEANQQIDRELEQAIADAIDRELAS